MDHARHLSSPSPTSPFLFHHSERPYKSNPLTPLLSSTADVTSVVDDCFSTNSSRLSSHQGHNPFVIDHTTLNSQLKESAHQHNQRSPVEDDLYPNQDDSPLLENTSASDAVIREADVQLEVGHQDLSTTSQSRGYHRDPSGNVDRDSLGEVDRDDDDDDGLHNMLSGSSTSSTSTIPLLSDGHSHHPYSRISLGEYSPLSLVDDCDNALPISPTLGSHSFKSSLNGCLKMDNLVGDDVDDDGRVVVHDDDVEDDARSLSPSMLNSSQHGQHNGLWSTSSTAITQSTSLLNGSSSSYLLSSHHQHPHHHNPHHHNPHHHQQLNSLIQQLEPQSLDEPPPLISDAHGSNQKGCTNFQVGTSISPSTPAGRPSSEPPPSLSLLDGSNNIAFQFSLTAMDGRPPANLGSSNLKTPKASQRSFNSGNKSNSGYHRASPSASSSSNNNSSCSSNIRGGSSNVSLSTSTLNSTSNSITDNKSSTSRPRRNRVRSRSSAKNKQQNKSPNKRCEFQQGQQLQGKKSGSESQQDQNATIVHSSRLHLQLNHHKKLQELQRRLFGTSIAESAPTTTNESELEKVFEGQVVSTDGRSSNPCGETTRTSGSTATEGSVQVKEEPDSSATSGEAREPATTTSSHADNNASKPTRLRPSRARGNRQVKNDTGNQSASSLSLRSSSTSGKQPLTSCTTTTASTTLAVATTTTTVPATTTNSTVLNLGTNAKAQAQKMVTAETAEPDTTTLTSDCVKLADLLNNCDTKPSSNTFIFNGFSTLTNQEPGSSREGTSEKRVQQIQVQVNPSLTVVANGLMQSPGIQQTSQTGSANAGLVLGQLNGANYSSQIVCRPQAIVASSSASGQPMKNIMSNSELKLGETVLSNWSLQAVNNGASITGNNSTNVNNTNQIGISANGQTIGAHQIAIQVICQDGTSLVLPVSSATGLNAAVSLTSQHQQLQAVLANNAVVATTNNQQRGSSNNQILPLVSVSNIVSQQQVVTNSNLNQDQSTGIGNANQSTSNSASQPTGLAASSPTLAALLDAGSTKNNNSNNIGTNNSNAGTNDLNGNTGLACQGFVSTNLLRKLVNGSQQNDSRQQNHQSNLPSAVVTVCTTPTPNTNTSSATSNLTSTQQPLTKGSSPEKRIKLEGGIEGSVQKTTFTIIEPHNLMVTTAASSECKQIATKQAINLLSTNDAQQQQQPQQQQQKFRNVGSSNKSNQAELSKSTKMSSSTGNRQVDPTQPFRCEHCNSTFTRLGNFTRHKKIHTVPTKVSLTVDLDFYIQLPYK